MALGRLYRATRARGTPGKPGGRSPKTILTPANLRDADLTEASRIIKTGADIVRQASGQPTDVVAITDLRQVQQRYEHADPETRAAVIAGLKAIRRLQRGEVDDQ